MIYITQINKMEDWLSEKENKLPNIIKKIIYFLKIKIKKIHIKNIENNEIIYIADNAKFKLIKYLKEKNTNIICASSGLEDNDDFINLLNINRIKKLDRKWLFKYLSIKITEYVLKEQDRKIEDEEIAILTNSTEDVIINTIIEISKKAKAVHIITNEMNKFLNIEEKLYDEYGIMINISNNYRKSLYKLRTILNFSFSDEELNKYELDKYAVIINFLNKVTIFSKTFEGINIHDYQIFMPKLYIKYLKYFEDFDQTTLYESFIYRKDIYKEIIKKIEEDNVRICTLVGDNGNIRRYEYERLLKKNRKTLDKFDRKTYYICDQSKSKIKGG